MKTITLHKTKNTPEIVIDYYKDTLTIEGSSNPESAPEFYEHVLLELKKYKEVKSKILLVINLSRMNTGSMKCLLTLFKEAAVHEGAFQKTDVEWMFPKSDKALRQAGEEFERISKLKFTYKEMDPD